MLRIMALMDNKLTGRKDLMCEHGLSLLVSSGGKSLLFDCGSSEKTLYNAQKLGVELGKLDAVVLSHAHYDHAGGFRFLAERYPVARVFTGPGFFEEKYAVSDNCYRSLAAGFDRAFLAERGIAHTVVEGAAEILPGIHAISGFPRIEPMETIPERFLRLTESGLIRDDFRDELCLALETEAGIVVLVGCAHPGIVNMVRHVGALLGKPVRAVLGGTHLSEASTVRIGYTVDALEKMGVTLLGLSHCSGDGAEDLIRQREGITACPLGPGDCVFFL